MSRPAHLDLRDHGMRRVECSRCLVGGVFYGTAAFRIECDCGGQVKVTKTSRAEEPGITKGGTEP